MKYVAVLACIGLAIFAFLMLDEFNRAGVLSSEGYIEQGSKFGIEIGMPVDSAGGLLARRGFELVELTAPQSCHGRIYDSQRQVELWLDESWRWATICVSSQESRIVSLSWHFKWLAP